MEWPIHKVMLVHAEDVLSAATGDKARVALIAAMDPDAALQDWNLRSPVPIRICGFVGGLTQQGSHDMLEELRAEWAEWRLSNWWFDIPMWVFYRVLEEWGINADDICLGDSVEPTESGAAHEALEDSYVQREDPHWIMAWHKPMVRDQASRNNLYAALVQTPQFQEWYGQMGHQCDHVYEWPLFCDWWYSNGAKVWLYRAFKNWLMSSNCSHNHGRRLDAGEAADPMAAFERMLSERCETDEMEGDRGANE